jgi:hypothetical protein
MKKSGILVGKRAQVTIFIILAIIIVVGIVTVYYLRTKPNVETSPTKDPKGYIEQCIQQSIDKTLPQILAQGGLINPDSRPENSVLYQNKYVPFLCYAEELETICTQNTPLLKAKIEEQLQKSSINDVENCFTTLRGEFGGYDYTESGLDYSINISPTELKVTAINNIKISRDGDSQEFNLFSYQVSSPIFDFVILTNKILNEEVGCNCGSDACRADVLALSKANKDFEITLFVGGNDVEIYTIKEVLTGQEFKFSVRNCVN